MHFPILVHCWSNAYATYPERHLEQYSAVLKKRALFIENLQKKNQMPEHAPLYLLAFGPLL